MGSDREALRVELTPRLFDAEILEEYREHAADIIAVGASRTPPPQSMEGGVFDGLDVEQRDAYLNELVDSLAPALMRFVLEWTCTDMVLVSEWLSRQ